MTTGWRERMQRIGKMGFIREEMERLGFWPPNPQVAEQAAEAEKQLAVLYRELTKLQGDLADIQTQIKDAGDVEKLLQEIRKRRIERVRAERAVRKETCARETKERRERDREWRRASLPYLGHGVSQGLVYDGGDSEKLAKLGLPILTAASELAAAIGIDEPALAWLTYHRGASAIDHYARFAIPKKRGGQRVISSPKRRLRVAQSWLLKYVLEPLPVHEAAMAFRPGVSVADNAARHSGRAVVIRIDLKDFFPSVTLPRVRRLFRSFGFNCGIATLMALLATEAPRAAVTLDGVRKFVAVGERSLPQGACTSPAITNLLCRALDARLTGAAQSLGFVYTRYADDLVFSHEKLTAPTGMLLDLVRRIIADAGFAVNEDKTVVMRPQHRQVVTGVVVNETPHVSREDIRRFRALLHRCHTRGFPAVSKELGKDARAYASGYLAFLHMVSPEQAQRLRAKYPGV
jgi:retron-type reverse transcriptase